MVVTELVLLGVLTGADNFVVSAVLGGLALSRRQRCWLAAAFGLWEAVMPWLGGALVAAFSAGGAASLALLGPACLVASGLLSVVGGAWAAGMLTRAAPSPGAAPPAGSVPLLRDGRLGWLTLLLPPALSLDNFAAGAGAHQPGAWPLTAALTIGGVSAALSALGLALGNLGGNLLSRSAVPRWRVPRALWTGSGLVLCGLIALAIQE